MKNILIFSERDFSKAPRIIREIEALKEHFNLFLIGINQQENLTNYSYLYSYLSIPNKIENKLNALINRKAKKRFSKIQTYLTQNKIDVVIIHEPQFLPLFSRLKDELGFKLIFNAHEYHPLEFEDDSKWMKNEGAEYEAIYERHLNKLDLLVNVCDSINQKCIEVYGVQHTFVLPNAAMYNSITPVFSYNNPIKVIHHGAILPSRKIEKMIQIIEELDGRFELNIMGALNLGARDYYNEVAELCQNSKYCKLIPPVPFNQIVETLNKYDLGFYLLEPSNFNNYYALPNKLFEFIQAKLAIIVSPSPEMKKIVEENKLGIVAEDFTISAMKNSFDLLTNEKINEYKTNNVIASKNLAAENFYISYRQNINALLES